MNAKKSDLDEKRRAYLWRLHRPVQKVALFYVGPVVILMFSATAYVNPHWQNFVRLGAMTSMVVVWGIAYYTSRKETLELGVALAVGSILWSETVELMMVSGSEAATMLAFVAATSYAALFSKQYIYRATGVTVFAVVLSELIKLGELYPVLNTTGMDRFVNQVIWVVVIGGMMAVILRRGQVISDELYHSLDDKNAAQKDILSTASRIQPVISGAVKGFQSLAGELASQASEQAAATSEVKLTVARVKGIADETATTAQKTHQYGIDNKEDALESRRRIIAVEKGYGKLVEKISQADTAMDELTAKASNIEEILDYNRNIGNQIKILAINAAIQAARAGKYGTAFRVVAVELKNMIQDTEVNLKQSYELLEDIRTQTRDTSEVVDESVQLLSSYYENMKETRTRVDRIVDSFVEISDGVRAISLGATKQSSSLAEVDVALDQINLAANGLEESGGDLRNNADVIATSQTELADVLARADEETL
ncbi:MAG: methyl-accepting chemotaxis protein [Myxococcota bacterium]|nr:methyl-accepting chemotaxis protein [Myxococcota bacterium]